MNTATRSRQLVIMFTMALVMLLSAIAPASASKATDKSAEETASTSSPVYTLSGKLQDQNGAKYNGTFDIVLFAYLGATGGNPVWTETHTGVSIVDGYVELLMGGVTSIPDSVVNTTPLYIGIKVGSSAEMAPRLMFTPTVNSARLTTTLMQAVGDNAGGVSLFTGIYGTGANLTVGHTYFVRAGIRLPNNWVPGTSVRIKTVAFASGAAVTVQPNVYLSIHRPLQGGWYPGSPKREAAVNLPLNAPNTDILIKEIEGSLLKSGDYIGAAFNFQGAPQMVTVENVYLEYISQ